jgi:hypothetical protein
MEIIPDKNYNLHRLQKWLDFELSSSSMLFFSWFWGFLLMFAAIAAVIFIPIMLKILYQEKKIGWIVYFIVLVVIPTILIYLLNIDLLYKFILNALPLGLFFFYCFTLKLAVRRWVLDDKFIRGETVFLQNKSDVFDNYKL